MCTPRVYGHPILAHDIPAVEKSMPSTRSSLNAHNSLSLYSTRLSSEDRFHIVRDPLLHNDQLLFSLYSGNFGFLHCFIRSWNMMIQLYNTSTIHECMIYCNKEYPYIYGIHIPRILLNVCGSGCNPVMRCCCFFFS